MVHRWLRPGTAGMRRAVGLVLLVASGCSRQEELEPDPGVSPFYPGPSARAKAPEGTAAPANRSATTAPDLDRPLRPEDVERQLRMAMRAAERGDSATAIALLDRILALEPVNREALLGRAAMALEQTLRAASPDERDAALDKAAILVRALHRAYERPNQREVELFARVLYEEMKRDTERGRLDHAVAVLKEAHGAGFDASDRIAHDPDLAKLRAYPGYVAFLKEIDAANLARARERVKDQLTRPVKLTFDFNTKDLDDKPLSLGQFKGQVVLVDIWGTWCGPCREAIPGLVQMYHKHRRQGFDIVGLDYEKGADPQAVRPQIKKFVQQSGMPYHIAMVDDALLEKIQAIPNFVGFPTTILFDRSGKPRMLVTQNSEQTLADLDAAITVLLADPATPAAGPAKAETRDAAKPH